MRQFPLTSFFALAYAWTWTCWWSVLALPASTERLQTLGQFGPFVAALIVTCATGGRTALSEFLASLVRWRVHPVWYGISLVLLPASMLTAIVLYASFHGTVSMLRFQGTLATLPAHFIYTLLLCGPLGEEPGWRGFALARLQATFSPVGASLVLGLLGAGWHLPASWIVEPRDAHSRCS
ncbi:MAG: CPBP family intramembrane metalloprotease [Planctomycetes bacterium]|nr:CPBP family intramembrane metalloprotease [Planctomycetota bacterium]